MRILKTTKVLSVLAASTFAFSSAHADTFSQSATVEFVSPITVTENTQLNFGTVETGAGAGTTLILDTAGAITGTASANYISGAAAGDFSVNAQGSTISIEVNNFGANTVTLSTPTCSYDGAGAAGCDTTITGLATDGTDKTLLIGATLTLAGSEGAGSTYSPTFDIVVNYE